MRVVYSLRSRDFDGVAAEAAWAESAGYDGVSTNETAHDSFLPLAVAATSTSRVTLETHVAIAFPRSPMVVALHRPRPAGRQQRPVPPGSGHPGEGTHRAAVLDTLDRVSGVEAA